MTKNIVLFLYKFHIVSIILGFGIIGLCFIKLPADNDGINIPYFDKIVHYIMYLFLCSAYLFESSHKASSGRFLNYVKGLFYCAIMAGTIELAQIFLTTYRSGEWADFWAGMAGAITSCLAAILIRLAFRSHGR